ncbi:MAG: isoprenylcysteine carboxylmethyltransferase family protein [Chloroflexi bacterium]|nr:isoprenylcysteine carboxylmethyltransferase family protein [Chloroflexota bacterium]
MSLVPVFKIGIWNAWIFMPAFLFLHGVAILVWLVLEYDLKAVFKKVSDGTYNTADRRIKWVWFLVGCLLLLYSIFLPLQLGTAWFYAGLAVCLVGLIIYEVAYATWPNTPSREPITKGPYRFSRHPVYIGIFVQLIGVGIASASWTFLLLAAVLIFLWRFLAFAEERICLERYGNSYREYMNRTPRWIGIPK